MKSACWINEEDLITYDENDVLVPKARFSVTMYFETRVFEHFIKTTNFEKARRLYQRVEHNKPSLSHCIICPFWKEVEPREDHDDPTYDFSALAISDDREIVTEWN